MLNADVEEVILLRASTTEDEFRWRGTEEEKRQWEDLLSVFLEHGELPALATPMAYAVRLKEALWLNVQCCTAKEDVKPTLTLQGPTIDQEQLRHVKEQLSQLQKHAQDKQMSNVVFEVFTGLQSSISMERDFDQVESSSMYDSVEDGNRANDSPHTDTFEMLRVIFWTHHLKAPSKKRDMNKWCAELRVFGLVKSGYPGFLCFEGEKSSVKEIIRRIKALQWHAISVKTEVPYAIYANGSENEETKPIDKALMQCLLATGHSSMSQHKATDGKTLRMSMDEVCDSAILVQR